MPQTQRRLAFMNWRRGLLLAGIHFLLGTLLVSWHEWHSWSREQGEQIRSAGFMREAAWQESPTVKFDPCNGGFVDSAVGPEERIVQFTNLPAWTVVGWDLPCPAHWTLAGLLQRMQYSRPAPRQGFVLPACLCVLIPVQWLLVGGFPFVQTRRWPCEPGALITVCSAMACVVVLFSWIDGYRNVGWVAQFPMLVVPFAWLWWLIVLFWKSLRQIRSQFTHQVSGTAS
jgi:hypothetical protein